LNLHAIVAPIIAVINPQSTLTIAVSSGYTTNPDGSRIPQYTLTTLVADVQGLDAASLRMVEGLNIQGISRRVWVNGQYAGVVRAAFKGGDLVTDESGQQWLITAVPEGWDKSGWCSFVMTLQKPQKGG